MKKIDNVEIIESKAIATLSQKVTQKIDQKHLSKFIRTSITNSSIVTNKNSYYYFTFMESSLTYEILVFDKNDKSDFILEPFLFSSYYLNNEEYGNNDIFILNNGFVLYKDQKFVMMKNIENGSLDDIKIYVTQTYSIDIDNIITIDNQEYAKLKENYINNYYKKDENLYNSLFEDNSFKIFQTFLMVSTIVLIYFIYEKQTYVAPKSYTNNSYLILEKRYKKYNTKPIDSTVEFFKYLKLNNITINKFEYNKNQIIASLVHEEKKKLLDFISVYNENITIKSIKSKDKFTNYEMLVTIKI